MSAFLICGDWQAYGFRRAATDVVVPPFPKSA